MFLVSFSIFLYRVVVKSIYFKLCSLQFVYILDFYAYNIEQYYCTHICTYIPLLIVLVVGLYLD